MTDSRSVIDRSKMNSKPAECRSVGRMPPTVTSISVIGRICRSCLIVQSSAFRRFAGCPELQFFDVSVKKLYFLKKSEKLLYLREYIVRKIDKEVKESRFGDFPFRDEAQEVIYGIYKVNHKRDDKQELEKREDNSE